MGATDPKYANLKQWVVAAAKGEPIEAIVIGNMGWEDCGIDDIPEPSRDRDKWNKVLSWAEAEPLLDYNFDSGYGAPGCQAITAWTATKVIFISQYDGATGVEWLPRHPVDHQPRMPGG